VPQVFISYSRKDKAFVSKLGDVLAAQKRDAWVDWRDIPLTAEWQQEIFTKKTPQNWMDRFTTIGRTVNFFKAPERSR
jgi:hypothetical protein